MEKSKEKSGLWTASFGQIVATLKALEDNGVTLEQLAWLRADPDFAKVVAEFIRKRCIGGSVRYNLAIRKIMGRNFFGVEEWQIFFGVNFSEKQLQEIADFPWEENILNSPCPFNEDKKIKETHFAFLGLAAINEKPLTILKWKELYPEIPRPRFYMPNPTDSRFIKNALTEGFMQEAICEFRWYLMPLEIFSSSINKTFEEQSTMLIEKYEIPTGIEEVTKCILYYRKNSTYLNYENWARCQHQITVGLFGSCGLDIDDWRGRQYRPQGLAASRKIPQY